MAKEQPKRRVRRIQEIEEEVPAEDTGEDSDKNNVGGYSPAGILKAPAKPPKPDTSETPEDTSNKKVIMIFLAAFVAALLGLVFMLMNLVFLSIPLFILAGAAILVIVFAPVH